MHGASAVSSQASAQLIQALVQNPQQKQTELATKLARVSLEQKLNPAANSRSGIGENLDVTA